MILRALAGLNLLLLAGILGLYLAAVATEFQESVYWRLEAKANEAEWNVCEKKHLALLKAIRKEGLWNRLGMPGQPWLH